MNSTLPNCLIVDSSEESLKVFKIHKERRSFNFFLAKTNAEAFVLIQKYDFSVFLIKLEMLNLDGFEMAKDLRIKEKTKLIPIVFFTEGVCESERILNTFELGTVDIIQSSFDVSTVLTKLQILVELSRSKALLKETQSSLQKVLKSRDEFLSICSHELKTPLTSLKMQIQMINRSRFKLGDDIALLPEKMGKFLDYTDRGLDRIIHLINDMLDITRMTDGRLKLNIEDINLGPFTAEVLDRIRPTLEIANCQVTLTTKDVIVQGDKYRMEQVLVNLLSNAAKYAADSPVEITVGSTNESATVSVKDGGQGILEEDQQRIFKRFERVDYPHILGGLGLGLFISKEIIELHGGQLEVMSTIGEGSNFTIKLPLMESVN